MYPLAQASYPATQALSPVAQALYPAVQAPCPATQALGSGVQAQAPHPAVWVLCPDMHRSAKFVGEWGFRAQYR